MRTVRRPDSACGAHYAARRGQSMVETLVAMLLICLVFAGFFQVSQILAAKEVLQHAAARGARARTVGFNRWMVQKCVLTAVIPNSGRLLEPAFENINQPMRDLVAGSPPGAVWSQLLRAFPVSEQYELERARIPEFLASENYPRSRYVLDYENWGNGAIWFRDSVAIGGDALDLTTHQDFPLTAPAHRAFYDDDRIELMGESSIENHYPLYLDDMNL